LLIEGLRRRRRLPLREEPLLPSAAHHHDDGLAEAIRRRKSFLVGTMGGFPVIIRLLRKALGFKTVGAECPVPKCFAGSVEIALRICTSLAANHTFEKRTPP
jgi:hypothetical protein